MPSSARPPAPPGTELARLCRYYLDCLARDADEGVTIPLTDGAAAKYAELPSMPLVSRDPEKAIHDECALVLLGRIARDQTSIGQLGYPVVLARGDRPAGHLGFYLEPIFLWPLDANGAL
jgi:hypothetical protein